MKTKTAANQLMKATIVEFVLVSMIFAIKILNPSFAKADPPARPVTGMVDVNSLPRAGRGAPRAVVRAESENVLSSGHRLILGVTYHGMGDETLPMIGTHYLAVDAEVGIGSSDIGDSVVSRVKLNFTPYRSDYGVGPDGSYGVTNIAPIAFERETSVGTREKIQIWLAGVELGSHPEYGEGLNSGIYGFYNIVLNALGYTYQHSESIDGSDLRLNMVGVADFEGSMGFGGRINQNWSIEWLFGEARVNMALGSNFSTSFQGELGSEVRIRFSDREGYTRATGYVRGQVRYNLLDPASESRSTIQQSALSIIAGLQIGF